MSQKIMISFEVAVPEGWGDNQIELVENALLSAAEDAANKVVDEHDDLQPAYGFDSDVVLDR